MKTLYFFFLPFMVLLLLPSISYSQRIDIRQRGFSSRNQVSNSQEKQPRLRYRIEGMQRFRRLSPNAKELESLLITDPQANEFYQRFRTRRIRGIITELGGAIGTVAGVAILITSLDNPNPRPGALAGLGIAAGSLLIPFTVGNIMIRTAPKFLFRSVGAYNNNKGYSYLPPPTSSPQLHFLVDAQGLGLSLSF